MKTPYKTGEWCPPLTAEAVGRQVYIPWPGEILPKPGKMPEKLCTIEKVISKERAKISIPSGYILNCPRKSMRPANPKEWPDPQDNARYWRRR